MRLLSFRAGGGERLGVLRPEDPAEEIELAVVIGRGGADIKREDARRHVFGYMVLNDVSARDIQAGWGGQYFKGKSLDRSCPTGPWIVTADEIDDPQSLGLKLSVNGV